MPFVIWINVGNDGIWNVGTWSVGICFYINKNNKDINDINIVEQYILEMIKL